MKKLLGIATAAVFGLGIFAGSAKAETIVTTDVLNVRENPTAESKLVGKMLSGNKLDVINTENGWAKIKLNGKEAFVSAEFTKSTYYVTAGVLNVRAGANTDSEILGKLNKDDVIETTNQVQNEWLQFDYNGKTGYVHVPFLTATAPVIEKKEVVTQEEAPVRVNTPVKNNKVVKSTESVKNVETSKPVAKEKSTAKQVAKSTETSAPAGGREITVEATAYTADPSENGTHGGRVLTAMGHDLTANPNMKVIAVDPKVIPLGSKVWVEGYGEAIAGDTGGAIKGNRIDVLVGSDGSANSWGRKSVKVKVIK
ncbi:MULTISPECIES: cell wall-binding protein EntD [Bacillus]|uniref:cell wall-binding protein EntD n=1 Tax=Bacillus TaxID=1386 RepID=UPI000330EC0E|nr:SH3 domain-containing protein [Bacillus wiedmannii]EOP12826.1 enterotoxin/cell-wall binding protein [Bacillus cereus BAG2O-3]EOQ09384.1 enterotoxin/cell-wall binding protein [Bacillus cereus B5-2]EOQ27405.1 enterotoxin/cell-wall binding protein [Bacillus cereus BAG3O-1]MBJ8113998.1 SH3 domain-containing protein [Bacillus cereus]PFW82655.1 enterotoxin [Bacillus sp. AFS075960]RFB24009.1 enterotoxin [Bacillus sp. LB(2018)]RFB49742.1 enterotoxin [Bacillus sp. dmp10]RFB76740.1 enterotoxin [Ba